MQNVKNNSNKNIGDKFEKHALDYLIKQGANLISKQYKTKYGEIDLIIQINQTIIFVEVKARKSNIYGGAIYSITQAKQQKIIMSAEIFLQQFMQDNYYNKDILHNLNYRFDVIIFQNGKIEWIQNCMESN
ncbi:MAG: hypothetical protein RLZZ210_1149 [Pseudomonadota bacterium]|jgi:putative endonuclease